ncbi:tetratricopeptide repeat protein [Tessaracoccus sp. G1721]
MGAHIWAAGQLVDVDPELAFRHAEAARRRAGRLPIVREAAAETAYAAGEYAVALREFRAIRRMSGGDELIPVIADCERALGRPRDALEVLAELSPKNRDIWLRIECLLVEAGTRADMGQRPEAMRLLQAAISRKVGPPFGQARLRYAYANLLEEAGDLDGAREWFSSAAALDQGTELDTADRIARLDGVVLPDFEPEDEDDELDADEELDADVSGEDVADADLDEADDDDYTGADGDDLDGSEAVGDVDDDLDADASDEDLADAEVDLDGAGELDADEDLATHDSSEADAASRDDRSVEDEDVEDEDVAPEVDVEGEDVSETDEQDDARPEATVVTDDDTERAADDGDAVDDDADTEEDEH